MIRAKRLAFRNAHQREIERMPLYQIERLRIAPKRNGDVLRRSPKLSFRGLAGLRFDIFKIYFSHRLITVVQEHRMQELLARALDSDHRDCRKHTETLSR